MRARVSTSLAVLCAVALLAGCGRSVVVSRERGAALPPRPVATRPASVPIPASGDYIVRRGDNLYRVAFNHNLDVRDVAARNGIAPPYTIYPGQRLRLAGSALRSAAAPPPRAPVVSSPSAGAPRVVSSSPAAPLPRPPATSPTPVASRPVPAPPAVTTSSVPTSAPLPPMRDGAWRWPADGQLVGRFVAGDQTRQGLDIAGSAGQPVNAAANGVVVYSGAGLVGYGELIILKHSEEWLSAYGHNRKRLVNEGQTVGAGQQIAEMGRSGASRDMLHFEVRRNGKPVDPMPLLPRR